MHGVDLAQLDGGVNADHQYALRLRIAFVAASDNAAHSLVQRLLASIDISMAPYRQHWLSYSFTDGYTAVRADGAWRGFGFCDHTTAAIDREQRSQPPDRFAIDFTIEHEANSDREAQLDAARYVKAISDALTPFAASAACVAPIALVGMEFQGTRDVGLHAALPEDKALEELEEDLDFEYDV